MSICERASETNAAANKEVRKLEEPEWKQASKFFFVQKATLCPRCDASVMCAAHCAVCMVANSNVQKVLCDMPSYKSRLECYDLFLFYLSSSFSPLCASKWSKEYHSSKQEREGRSITAQ